MLEQDGERHMLAVLTTIGRDGGCRIVIPDETISQLHAAIVWNRDGWLVRDLGSTNGTFLNGRRLTSGSQRPLKRGDRLSFGVKGAAWRLADDGPPVVVAVRQNDESRRIARDGVLALPDETDPRAVILEQAPQVWILEAEGETRPLENGALVTVGGTTWSISIPAVSPTAVPLENAHWTAEHILLEFAVSRDEEQVALVVHHGEERRNFEPQAELYLLLTLARRRLADAGSGVADEDAGWLSVDALCDALRISESLLNVQVHRLRSQLAVLGLLGSGGIIDRRRKGRLRIATGRVTSRAL